MKINNKQIIAFWVIFIVLSIHFKFYETINLPPQSTDLWRQSDCYSIALNYYQNGFHFFKPQVHFQFAQNGYAAGEFPIIYFIAAILFKIFGVHFFLFKGLNLLVFFTGLFYLFKLALKITTDVIFSYIIAVLYFCTPVVFFYANNFLSDVSALSFNIIGFYYFLSFLELSRKKHLTISAVCFTMAGLLKASATIFLIALICAIFTELFLTKSKSKYYSLINNQKALAFTLLFSSVILIVSWYLYAIYFNKSNETIFFGTKAMEGWPIWENNLQEFKAGINYFRIIHIEILSFVNICFFIISLVLLAVFNKKIDSLFLKISLFLMLGLTMFVAYFWKGFQDQQYYLVNLLILPIYTIIMAVKIFFSLQLSQKVKAVSYTIAFMATLFVIYTSKNIYRCYYKDGWRHQKLQAVYYDAELEKKLNSMGITKHKKVISLQDGTPNGTLAILNRKGWSSYGFAIKDLYNKESFESKINMGASFLILNDTSLLSNLQIKNYLHTPVGNYKELYFFKIGK